MRLASSFIQSLQGCCFNYGMQRASVLDHLPFLPRILAVGTSFATTQIANNQYHTLCQRQKKKKKDVTTLCHIQLKLMEAHMLRILRYF